MVTDPTSFDQAAVARWVRAVPIIFVVLGLSFGSWLSRLPAVRDHLGASPAEMSWYGLCFASGSLVGLIFSGRIVHRFGPRQVILLCMLGCAILLPAAASIILYIAVPPGLAVLFAFGLVFGIADVAINVTGANAEVAFGRPRMPLMHAGYSFGTVAATGLGALAERLGIPVPLHFAVIMGLGTLAVLPLLRALPRDEQAIRTAAIPAYPTGPIPIIESAAGQQPAFSTATGSIPIQRPNDAPPAQPPASPLRSSNPLRDPRILTLGLIALIFGLLDGTPADWLPLALVDARGISNELGSIMLSVFFAALMFVRVLGSWLIERFGRVAMLRVSAVCAIAGISLTILSPLPAAMITGVIIWGLGTGLGWPIAISAAADDASTAARAVGLISAIGYGSMLLGPLGFGLIGEHIGLLNSFWIIVPFVALVLFVAQVSRSKR